MPLWTHYHIPESIDQALDLLANAPGPARIVAGGTDLLLDLQQGRHAPVDTLVDVTRIPRMNELAERDGELVIGAGVPLAQIAASPLVCQHARALVEACALIGGPQVRNVATLGGNVAHAMPAADGSVALMALGAQATIAACGETPRRVPLAALYRGPGQSTLDAQREVLVSFHVPLAAAGEGCCFRRVMRPQGVALPVLNLAGWLRVDQAVIVAARLSVGPSGTTPRRAPAAEAALTGQCLQAGTLAPVLDALLGELRFRTSPRRASAEYRHVLAGVLLEEVVTTAWQRSQAALSVEGER